MTNPLDPSNDAMSISSIPQWYQCSHCPAAFDDRTSLKSHEEGHRTQTASEPLGNFVLKDKTDGKRLGYEEEPSQSSRRRRTSFLPASLSLEVDIEYEDGAEDDIINECGDDDASAGCDALPDDDGPSQAKRSRLSLVSEDGEYCIPFSDERLLKFANILRESRVRRKREAVSKAAFASVHDYKPQSVWEERMIAEWDKSQVWV